MAEMERTLYNATDREGRLLPPNAIRILGYLWTFVSAAEAVRYRAEQVNRRAPRVQTSPAQLAKELAGLEVESLSKLLKKLREAGYILADGDHQTFALLDQRHRDEYLHVLEKLKGPSLG